MSTIFFTIQFMKFYLHMAYGDLATFYGGGLNPNTPSKVFAKAMELAQQFG